MRQASSVRSTRSKSHTRRYHVRAPTSEVDETLFGSQKLLEKPGNSASKAKKESPKKRDEKTIQIITKDLIRNLRIPSKDPSEEVLILSPGEYERIIADSKVLTKEEKEARKEADRRKKEEEKKAAEEWRRRLIEADLHRETNRALTDLEIEARDRRQRLVERASALRMEEEEEVKQFNKLILNAQCKAILDAQIEEKTQVQAVMLDEEKRLDVMMEIDRCKALETEEQIDELRKQQRIRGKQQICDQIEHRLIEKRMNDALKESEREQLRENQEKMNLEDLKALEKKKEEQQRLQEEIMRTNAETMRAKEQRREQEKLDDMRNMEYMQNKLEREAKHEAEQRRLKKEKELEIARLRAQQEKAKHYKAEQDELRARRQQESLNREWRRKEKELAEKRVREEGMLRAARLEQVHLKEHQLSIEAGREKAEFERVLKVQQEASIKQKEEDEKKRQKAQRYADGIRHQVKQRELSAIAKRRETFQEADRMVEEERQRRLRLHEIKEKKLKELKDTGLDEKYCSQVDRKAKAVL